ncbi:hypothetical protein [Porphyrobacter sp. YT40]|uniref:hypothetical protein n=1 Tax=Porphyrobacter sp. YT40 TaxID=2547601 RepID=UPI001143EB1D|nr:hypothetical protein [Porphyrobacter sp. YT40]QDH35911.1 hypothetical protein E2E27_17235 [Porphyrobacter sp. YT40]
MIRKLIGASIGASLAKRHKAAGGVTGAVVAGAVPAIIARISLPAMAVIGVGGYLAKRYLDKKAAEPTPPQSAEPTKPAPQTAPLTPQTAPMAH